MNDKSLKENEEKYTKTQERNSRFFRIFFIICALFTIVIGILGSYSSFFWEGNPIGGGFIIAIGVILLVIALLGPRGVKAVTKAISQIFK